MTAFDALAGAYDAQFTTSIIGGMMRRAVWARCAARFSAGMRVLEMNCGTGEDALWLAQRGVQVLATDVSSAMLQVAHNKFATSPRGDRVRVQQLAWEDLATLNEAPFDGALSNFGGLNCIVDLRAAARSLAAKLRRGAPAILCIMGPAVPWEWLWYMATGKPASAFRRLRRGGSQWSGISIQYPSIGQACRAFSPEFCRLRVSGIGALLPPPYTESVLGRYPRLLAALNGMERRIDTLWPLPRLADHYLLELERV